MRIDSTQKIHTHYILGLFQDVEQQLSRFGYSASALILIHQIKFNETIDHFQTSIKTVFERSQSDYQQLNVLLRTLDPQAILLRGYAIVTHNNLVLRSTEQVQINDGLVIQLAKGSIEATVTKRSII
ncbi:hypothetical protein H0W80_00575 [Candidatus Saccharibacteria bacterium]|nr:hypothetical protein [Candidatus Saccharibacteria bacterium]